MLIRCTQLAEKRKELEAKEAAMRVQERENKQQT